MDNIQSVKDSILREIKTRQEALGVFDLLPAHYLQEVFPNGHWRFDWISNFEFVLPYSFQLIETVKQFMTDQMPDWKAGRDFQCIWDGSNAAGYFLSYRNEALNIKFDMAFRSSEEGSTCVLNKIGEKTVPIFEVVCSQQAAEEF